MSRPFFALSFSLVLAGPVAACRGGAHDERPAAPTPAAGASSSALGVAAAVAGDGGLACAKNADCVPDDVCIPRLCVDKPHAKVSGSCPDVALGYQLLCTCVKGRCRTRRVDLTP